MAGTTQCRPAGGGYGLCRGGAVEIHIAVDELARLADDPAGCGRWASVVAEIARGYADRADTLARLCGRHHRDKTERGWTLAQPEPGRFRWTSPLGRSYRTRGEPIRPPSVSPCPRPAEPDAGAERHVSGPVLTAHVPRRHTPPPGGRGPDADDEPPF